MAENAQQGRQSRSAHQDDSRPVRAPSRQRRGRGGRGGCCRRRLRFFNSVMTPFPWIRSSIPGEDRRRRHRRPWGSPSHRFVFVVASKYLNDVAVARESFATDASIIVRDISIAFCIPRPACDWCELWGHRARLRHRNHDAQVARGPAGIAVFVPTSGPISDLTAPGQNGVQLRPFATGKLSAAVRTRDVKTATTSDTSCVRFGAAEAWGCACRIANGTCRC
jgi:hypothetical protein